MNFYKITNEEENHNGLQYKTGLNVDPLPWNPSGSCESGGIYFSREDILAFMHCGPWIRKINIPRETEVYEDPDKPKKWKAHKVILGKRRKINASVIRELLEEGSNVHASNNCAFKWASRHGHLEIVKLLVEHGADVHVGDDWPLRWASKNGHLEIVKLLVEHGADIHVVDEWPLRWARMNGHTKVVEFLLKHGASQ